MTTNNSNNNGNKVAEKVVTFVGLGCIIPLVIFCLLISAITIIVVNNRTAPANTTVIEAPAKAAQEEVSKPSSNEEQASSVSGSTEDSERVCKFIDGYDTNGKVVPAGTNVKGPAFVKPDRNVDWGLPVYVGESYTTKASDEVVWLLDGDNACVDSQSAFFSFWGKTLTK